MSGYYKKSKRGGNCDHFVTPKSAWQAIEHLIPKNLKIYEPFYCDGLSGQYLAELGYDVIHEDTDFFKNTFDYDIIVSNPSFSNLPDILDKLATDDKPFVLLIPALKVHTNYWRKWRDKNIQIIIPRKRIHYTKTINGVTPPDWKNATPFESYYMCYRMNLDKDILWLE